MRHTILIAALAAVGCGGPRAVATYTVAASDAAADTLADSWKAATTERVAECRALNLDSEEARAECLGKFHPDETGKVIAAVEVLVTVQLAVKAAAECESLKTCASTTDWGALASQAKQAWDALKPYAKIVKENEE